MTARAAAVLVLATALACAAGAPEADCAKASDAAAPQDCAVTATVGPAGATLVLPGLARLRVPDGALPSPTAITLAATRDPAVEADWQATAVGPLGAGPRLPWEVRVRVAGAAPRLAVQVTATVPHEWAAALPAGYHPLAFRYWFSTEGEDVLDGFDPVPESYQPAPGAVVVEIPSAAFHAAADGSQEALVVVGSGR